LTSQKYLNNFFRNDEVENRIETVRNIEFGGKDIQKKKVKAWVRTIRNVTQTAS